MYVPEIIQVKEHFEVLKQNGILENWELPYENLLTRRSAAIFFFTPADPSKLDRVFGELDKYDNFSCRENSEKKLSQLEYRVTFNKEEKESNLKTTALAN
ncbi:hypothetical protein Q4E93_32880 [Flavitalea sp. BT771]|uniref:hypothetical protein n=1 Tax=Flavitalea sp. BT771 TaxID=3063329 RepID=UPI0026E3AC6B|nr:hypothetical protein [Flavitalea sp. BT771]MDO6435455.1 hypothetical protein [Flavitalea sp. BT771]MDV6224185.1 hypothetical protein [Flavitalea sp. BT771]